MIQYFVKSIVSWCTTFNITYLQWKSMCFPQIMTPIYIYIYIHKRTENFGVWSQSNKGIQMLSFFCLCLVASSIISVFEFRQIYDLDGGKRTDE